MLENSVNAGERVNTNLYLVKMGLNYWHHLARGVRNCYGFTLSGRNHYLYTHLYILEGFTPANNRGCDSQNSAVHVYMAV